MDVRNPPPSTQSPITTSPTTDNSIHYEPHSNSAIILFTKFLGGFLHNFSTSSKPLGRQFQPSTLCWITEITPTGSHTQDDSTFPQPTSTQSSTTLTTLVTSPSSPSFIFPKSCQDSLRATHPTHLALHHFSASPINKGPMHPKRTKPLCVPIPPL
ncbi:hypothetical protein CCACVL1_18315 [Corchorus capsularis]|uniref:Uncharacterized protein n=1 Tax=Corchorus capsularis TaxID=210143 RepID=A0A1R3HLF9_COCAP|nr:hypothetical protein CCACVL1_18315 [Corchorus capsularis]